MMLDKINHDDGWNWSFLYLIIILAFGTLIGTTLLETIRIYLGRKSECDSNSCIHHTISMWNMTWIKTQRIC